ncbi:MAG: homoserine dehydrogenase [Myxococcales bacterium]|nr:homoserine dehydrogenase [Myxococcales bacterium]
MGEIRIGLLGCGVVGQGVMALLSEHAASIEARLGTRLSVSAVAVRDLERDRGPHVPAQLLTREVERVVEAADVDIAVELMGGLDPAGDYVQRALAAGKSVVTANKALIADRGHALIEQAEGAGCDLYFEAAVAGGVPVLRVLREALASDRVTALRGIINGTSNYILSRMQSEGMEFAQALAEAQAAGYAEADPTLDVGGGDAAHKLLILATLAFGKRIALDSVATEGIDRVAALDIEFARRFGYVIKPLSIARQLEGDALELRVHPALVDRRDPLAHMDGALNAVQIEGAGVGPCLLSGLGAGSLPTAVSVLSDIIDVARNHLCDGRGRVPARAFAGASLGQASARDMAEHHGRYYLRFSVRDQSGVLGQLATALGARDVSIEQMVQEGRGAEQPVSVVLLTHPAREGDVRAALAEIDAFDVVVEPTCVLRIEE